MEERQQKIMNPAAGSMVMAMGIFLYATVDTFSFMGHIYKQGLVIGLLFLLGWMGIQMVRQCLHKAFITTFFHNPVNVFLAGTWVAGIAVFINVMLKYFPASLPLLKGAAMGNTVLYGAFLVLCVYNFQKLFHAPSKYQVHGAVLLSTVATQALVVMWVEIFGFSEKPVLFLIISLGLVFYGLGFGLIGRGMMKHRAWSLADDWSNTNCIIHGALSITGLALVLSQTAPSFIILLFWHGVLVALLGVEVVEIGRAKQRIRRYGWREGIFTYHVSQWSRNFTFGMFYAFTAAMHKHFQYHDLFEQLYTWLLPVWGWLVFMVLTIECVLWARTKGLRLEKKL